MPARVFECSCYPGCDYIHDVGLLQKLDFFVLRSIYLPPTHLKVLLDDVVFFQIFDDTTLTTHTVHAATTLFSGFYDMIVVCLCVFLVRLVQSVFV